MLLNHINFNFLSSWASARLMWSRRPHKYRTSIAILDAVAVWYSASAQNSSRERNGLLHFGAELCPSHNRFIEIQQGRRPGYALQVVMPLSPTCLCISLRELQVTLLPQSESTNPSSRLSSLAINYLQALVILQGSHEMIQICELPNVQCVSPGR